MAGRDPARFALAAAAAGAWVVISGMLMAAAFGYREMTVAFAAVGLPVPRGLAPLITHTLVRLVLGGTVVALFAVLTRGFSRTRAMLLAAGVAWLLAMVLPYAVIAQWGLFPWSLAAKLWAWSAGELLIAALIGRSLYRTGRVSGA